MTETTSAPAFLPGQRTSGHGVWSSIGGNAYNAVSEAFILFDSPTNPPGLKTGAQKIIQAIVLNDENHFSSLASVKFFQCRRHHLDRLRQSGRHTPEYQRKPAVNGPSGTTKADCTPARAAGSAFVLPDRVIGLSVEQPSPEA